MFVFGERLFSTHGWWSHLVDAIEVVFWFVCVWFHCFGSWFPASRTNFTMNVGVLECLHQTQCFVNTTANGQIVYGNLAQSLFAVDDVQATEWDSRFFIEDFIVACDFHRFIGQQWNIQCTQTALFAFRIDPGQMGELTVRWAANNFTADFAEVFNAIRKGNDFRGANERTGWEEIEGKRFSVRINNRITANAI